MKQTRYEDTIVCPHCGFRFDEPYEFFSNGSECAETECERCGKPLGIVQHVSIKYSAREVVQV